MLAQSQTDRIGLSRLTMCWRIKSNVRAVGSRGVLHKTNVSSQTCCAAHVGNVEPMSLLMALSVVFLGMGHLMNLMNQC